LAQDPQAMAIGDRLFMNNCAQCHGSDARGSKGFPNLTDDNWTWGGTPEQIHETIVKGRMGIMTPMAAAVGTSEDVRNLANYVMSLSNGPHDSVRANLGKSKFTVCAACHGLDGKGNQALGAPNLTRGVFIYGPAVEPHITDMIMNGRTGVMPAWDGKFTPEQITVLTAYVWGKGGGVPGAQGAAVLPVTSSAAGNDVASVSVDNGVVKFFFATGKSEVASGADKALADVVAGVLAGKKAVVSGYVDSTGNAAQNAELAKQRAFAVRDQLKAMGVAEDKIELKEPENIEAGAGGQARRVEVSLV
jgi:mono/diheme cytochrome c family protein